MKVIFPQMLPQVLNWVKFGTARWNKKHALSLSWHHWLLHPEAFFHPPGSYNSAFSLPCFSQLDALIPNLIFPIPAIDRRSWYADNLRSSVGLFPVGINAGLLRSVRSWQRSTQHFHYCIRINPSQCTLFLSCCRSRNLSNSQMHKSKIRN